MQTLIILRTPLLKTDIHKKHNNNNLYYNITYLPIIIYSALASTRPLHLPEKIQI